MVEVQIRTREMHRTAELGIAAHYSYKEGGRPDHELADRLDSLLTQTSEWQAETSDAREFMDLLRVSLYQDEVFVFTPKRDLRRLPKGSTPIDFAYMIHSEVGDRCVGARVNGRIVPLRHHLRNGDVVEIQTSPSGRPSEAWLKIVRTPRAKAKVRHYLRERRLEDAAALGREMIDRECRRNREKVPVEKDLLEAAQGLGLEDVKHLLAAVGRGDMSALHVFHRLFPSREPSRPSPLATVGKLRDLAFRAGRGLRIQNVDNLMIQMARCCSPVPGEKVVGIITRGRGISVHRASCPNTSDPALEPERRIALQWDVDATRAFLVKLVVHGREREGLLADIAQAITDMKTNIRRAGVASRAASARGVFIIEVRDLQHLRSVIAAMKKVKGVTRIDRYHQISGGERAEG
jgi:GTP pyrophosphokinase